MFLVVGPVDTMACLGIRKLLEGFLSVICFNHYYCHSSLIGPQDGDVGVILEEGNGFLFLNRRWVAGVIVT